MAADSLADALDALSVAPLTIDSTDDQLRLIVECVPHKQLASLRRVCKTWRRVLDADEQLWERACRSEWSLRWWWAWGVETRPSTWRAWWLEGREVQLPKRALTGAEWWKTQPQPTLLHSLCFGFTQPAFIRVVINVMSRGGSWRSIMLQFGFNEDELPDGCRAHPSVAPGTSAADLHRSRTPDAVVMWVSLALLAMRVGAISVDLLDEEDPQRPFLSASPRYVEAHRPFFGASIFEQRLKREDVIHQGDSPLTIWLGRWIDIVGWMGKVLGGSRSYRAGDDPPRLIRQRPYAAEVHLPPYKPWRLRGKTDDLRACASTGAVLLLAPHSGRPGLLLTCSRSFLLPGQPTFDLPVEEVRRINLSAQVKEEWHVAYAHGEWDRIRAECAEFGLPAGFELEEVERGSTECLRAAEKSISRWKLLRRHGAHSSSGYAGRPYSSDGDGRALDATWAWALGFFNLVIDDGREQDLPDMFYELGRAPVPEPEEEEGEDPNEGYP